VDKRTLYSEFSERVLKYDFILPRLIHKGDAISVKDIEPLLDMSIHGPLEEVEGAIWRVERKGKVDFLVKYVRHSKRDGKYLNMDVLNELPPGFEYLLNL
jgi:hypothetical protein